MARLDPSLRRDLKYLTVCCLILSLLMEAIFLVVTRRLPLSVPAGNAAGLLASLLNYYLLCLTVQKALAGKPEDADKRMRLSKSLRMLMQAAVCALAIGLLKTNAFATLIPLVFPRIALTAKPAWDRRQGISPSLPDQAGEEEKLD